MVYEVNACTDAPDLIEVQRRADHDAMVDQQLSTQVTVTTNRVNDLQNEARPILRGAVLERTKLKRSLHDLSQAHEAAVPHLFLATWEEEKEWIERFMPGLMGLSW